MAHLVRLPKAGSDWTFHELAAYHIRLQQEDPLQFFDLEELPQPVVDPEILNNLDAAAMKQDNHAVLINLLDLAMIPAKGENGVDDFTVELLKHLSYVRRHQVARTRVDIPLNICGQVRHAKTDVCLILCKENDIMLLVQEEKRLEDTEPINARARLIAGAIAAFTENNVNKDALGYPPFADEVIPGIVMVGTMPTFFQIHVTQALATHVAFGTYPPDETVVTYCYPPVPRPARCRSEGMKPLDNRREVLKCFEAFKTILGI